MRWDKYFSPPSVSHKIDFKMILVGHVTIWIYKSIDSIGRCRTRTLNFSYCRLQTRRVWGGGGGGYEKKSSARLVVGAISTPFGFGGYRICGECCQRGGRRRCQSGRCLQLSRRRVGLEGTACREEEVYTGRSDDGRRKMVPGG
jgi:hypothetical protein